MKPEDQIKDTTAEKKPMRVFGEEDISPAKPKPAVKKPSRKQAAPKVDQAIKRDKAGKESGAEKAPGKKKPDAQKTAAKKKRKAAARKKAAAAGQTFVRMGTGLKKGTVVAVKYGKRAMKFFDAYTSLSSPEV